LENIDFWLVQTDASGVTVWDTFEGGTGLDAGIGLVEIADGEYAVAGGTASWGAGGLDGWLVRFGAGLTPFELDSLALVALYNSTDGANWTDDTNWLSADSALDTWYGVTVSGGRVTKLHLFQNLLTGPLPTEIGDLTGLTWLYLANNQLSGPIPASIGNLTGLQSLVLDADNPIPTSTITTSLPDRRPI
ncbi:hypothetical protein ACFL5M_02910, partial [Candidatus Neomarinimicrobiota bacterium]